MKRYTGTYEEDLRVLRWYGDLVSSRELTTTFVAATHPLGSFFGYFRGAVVMYEPGGDRFAFVSWLTPMLNGWLFGVYVHPRWRRTRTMIGWVETAIEEALSAKPVLLGFTRRPRMATTYVKFGFKLAAKVPYLADGEPTYVLMITKAMFEAARDARRARVHALRAEEAGT